MAARLCVTQEDTGIRLDRWFKRHYPNVQFTVVAKLIRTGNVKLNGKRADVSTRINDGDSIIIPDMQKYETQDQYVEDRPRYDRYSKQIKDAARKYEQNILYQDEYILVFDKPEGIATQGGSKIVVSVDEMAKLWMQWNGEMSDEGVMYPRLVHRLDKDTSGILVIAKSPYAASLLAEQFRTKKVVKKYVALVYDVPKEKNGVIRAPINKVRNGSVETIDVDVDGKDAVTEYKVLDSIRKTVALVQFVPLTGRTHQIRVHSKFIGHPIIGDDKYGFRPDMDISGVNYRKLYLNAHEIELSFNGKKLAFKSKLPEFMLDSLASLGLHINAR